MTAAASPKLELVGVVDIPQRVLKLPEGWVAPSVASQAKACAERYAVTQEMRYQSFLGIRYTAAWPRLTRRTVKLVSVPDAGQRVA